MFQCSVSAAAINENNIIIVGLESGVIEILQYEKEAADESKRITSLLVLDQRYENRSVFS